MNLTTHLRIPHKMQSQENGKRKSQQDLVNEYRSLGKCRSPTIASGTGMRRIVPAGKFFTRYTTLEGMNGDEGSFIPHH
jgi:hypothetical protein